MDATWLVDLVSFALPGGFLGAVASWAVGRRKRNNDFLAEMQRSIDLLSEKYNQVLQENVSLRCEKAEWQVLQQELVRKVDRLTREIEGLRRKIDLKTENHEKRSVVSNRLATVVRAGDVVDGLLCGIPEPDAAVAAASGRHRSGAGARAGEQRPVPDVPSDRRPTGDPA